MRLINLVFIGCLGCVSFENQDFPVQRNLPVGKMIPKRMDGNIVTPSSDQAYQQVKKVTVVKQPNQHQSGSLWNEKDSRNYLFLDVQHVHVGQTVKIAFADIKAEEETKKREKEEKKIEKEDDSSKKTPAKGHEKTSGDTIEQLEAKILAMELEVPPIAPLESIKAQVVDVSDEGIVTLEYKRYSVTPNEEKQIMLQMKVPKSAIKDAQLSGNDLQFVKLIRNVNDEIKIVENVGWNMELTHELQNFEGALTQEQQQLRQYREMLTDSKRLLQKQMEKVREQYRKLTLKEQKATNADKSVAEPNKAVTDAKEKGKIEEKVVDEKIKDEAPKEENNRNSKD